MAQTLKINGVTWNVVGDDPNCEIKAGCKLKKVIMDRFNTIAARQTIGLDLEKDSQKYYIDPSGIIVIPRGKNKF
mgnify:CR=1 FL=1